VQVTCAESLDELSGLAESWNALSGGVPFRQWAWCTTWWRHYGDADRLFVLAARDDAGELVAIAPWYISRHPAKGRVVRFLGSGEVCSDYQTLLCVSGREDEAAAAMAAWLSHAKQRPRRPAWDLLEFSGIEAADVAMQRLFARLAGGGNHVHTRRGVNCWRLELPATWEEYLARLSKNHRGRMRRLERRVFGTGRAVWHTVQTEEQFPAAFDRLVELHERRWQARGEPGVFASPRFTAFHRDVALQLLRRGQLRLHWLELEGRAAAAAYHFASRGVVYIYQGGMEPELLHEEPGSLSHLATLKQALAEGARTIDFLRGDEPYKPHLRAQPLACVDVRVVPRRITSRLRHTAWLAGKQVKRWLSSNSDAHGSHGHSARQHDAPSGAANPLTDAATP
jgi:CelD/BcsL family acetyltransferase involved in cellulose biosynthesis